MNIDKIIEYVMNTPGNTNPSMLRSILEAEAKQAGTNKIVLTTVYDPTTQTELTEEEGRLLNKAMESGFPISVKLPYKLEVPEEPSMNQVIELFASFNGFKLIEPETGKIGYMLVARFDDNLIPLISIFGIDGSWLYND